MSKRNRPGWEEFALIMARAAAQRSEDPYVQVGACVLRHNNSVAGVGYNGAPEGIEIDWSDRDIRRRYAVHAETNCLRYCKPGECRLIATTLLPCPDCMKQIASYGIKTAVFSEMYDKDTSALDVANVFGIKVVQIFPPSKV
jgi:dCMP deaminase